MNKLPTVIRCRMPQRQTPMSKRAALKRCARGLGWLSGGLAALACLYIGWALTHPIPECRSRDSEWKVWCLFGHRNAIFQWEGSREKR